MWFTKQAIQVLQLGSVLYNGQSLQKYDKIHSLLNQILDAQAAHEIANHSEYRPLELVGDRSVLGRSEWFINPKIDGIFYSVIPKVDLGFDMESLTGIGNMQRRLKYLLLAQFAAQELSPAESSQQHQDSQISAQLSVWGDHSPAIRKTISEISEWKAVELQEHQLKSSRSNK